MLAPLARNPDRAAAAARVKAWTRERFALDSGSTVLVTELDSALPGFPPRHTEVAFWIAERHYHFRVFKPLAEVVAEDLPPRWYKEALALAHGVQCGCC